MKKLCPNCSKEFVESRETSFHCEDCGWFKNVDGKWRPCSEPAKVTEPDLPKVPKSPVEPKLPDPPEVPEDDNVRSYLGGMVTVTTIKDDEDEETVD